MRATGAACLTVFVLAAVASPAGASPTAGPTSIVTLGDSYISGEAGRWQGNSVTPAAGNDGTDRACRPAGPACQVDKASVYVDGTAANGCHRSDVAEVLTAVVPTDRRVNLACSGAVTKNIFRAASGGEAKSGEAPQADQLVAVARDTRVKAVVLSIGGNDLGFASIVGACFQTFLSKQGPCEPSQQPLLDAAVPKATLDVEKAIDEIRAVMAGAGYDPKDYRLIAQTYPSVIPRASESRYSETDPQRSNVCPFYDQDLTWGRTKAAPEISSMVKAAAAARGVEVLDLGDAFQGHEFCSKSTRLATPTDPPSPVTSEWGRFLGASTVQQGDLQETFHPNAYGQQAFGACLGQMYAQPVGRYACDPTPGRGPDGMVLRRVGDVGGPAQGAGSSTGPTATPPAVATHACQSRRALRLHLRKRYRGRVRSATVTIAGRRVARFRTPTAGARVDLRGRPAGPVTVRIVVRLRSGQTAVDVRRYRLCGS